MPTAISISRSPTFIILVSTISGRYSLPAVRNIKPIKVLLIGFSKLFVKEGRASDKLSQFLEKLAAYRLEADYKSTEFSAADVAALMKKAEEFIAFAEAYLKKAME